MFRKLLLAAVALLSINGVFARTITGEVRSDKDSTVVESALCRLYSDGKMIEGVLTNSRGEFEINTPIKSKIRLDVSMTGYNTTSIMIESGKNVSVGTVYIVEGLTLEGVEFTANATVDARGRTIVFPSESDIKSSATSVSLFQKLPLAGLEANPINRTLSVDGGTPLILINGIPSTIDDFNTLQPKDIAKIEFSRITPARYADRGHVGLISITLKKRDDGGQIYMWGRSAVNTVFVDANINTSYHQGPSQFTIKYSPSWRNYSEVYDYSKESYIGDDFRMDMTSTDRNPFNYHTHNVSVKYDYSPNINTLFSAALRLTPYSTRRRLIGSTSDDVLGNYTNYNLSSQKELTPSIDLFFKRDFNEKNALEFQVVGTLAYNDYRRSNEYKFSDGNVDNYNMDVDSRRRSLISEISYIHQFSAKTSLSVGYQNTVSHSVNTYLSSDYKPLLTENNNYFYARLGQQVNKVYFSVSSGAKMYWIKNDFNRRNFIRNISTVQFSWNISSKWNLVGAFQYSPIIPSLSALTDYPQQQTPYLISNGNPNLKVSDVFLYQLMPSYRYKKFNASLLINYKRLNDCATNEVVYLGDKMFLSQTINARKAWYTTAGLNLKISDIAGFGANLYISYAHYVMSGQGWIHHLNSWYGSFTLWWNHGPYTISYWRTIPGKYLIGQTVDKNENGDALSFEYNPNKHWTVGVNWMYMFEKKGTQYPSWSYSAVNPATRDRYIKHNGNMVTLTVSYTTDFGSIFRSSRRSLNNSDSGSSLLQL